MSQNSSETYQSILAKFLIRIYYDFKRNKNKDSREIFRKLEKMITSTEIENILKDNNKSKQFIEDLLKIMKVFIALNSKNLRKGSESLINYGYLRDKEKLNDRKQKAEMFIKALNLHKYMEYYGPLIDFFAIITNSSLRGKYYAYLLSEYNKLQIG